MPDIQESVCAVIHKDIVDEVKESMPREDETSRLASFFKVGLSVTGIHTFLLPGCFPRGLPHRNLLRHSVAHTSRSIAHTNP